MNYYVFTVYLCFYLQIRMESHHLSLSIILNSKSITLFNRYKFFKFIACSLKATQYLKCFIETLVIAITINYTITIQFLLGRSYTCHNSLRTGCCRGGNNAVILWLNAPQENMLFYLIGMIYICVTLVLNKYMGSLLEPLRCLVAYNSQNILFYLTLRSILLNDISNTSPFEFWSKKKKRYLM